MYLILKKTRQEGKGEEMNIFVLHTYDIEKSKKKNKLCLMWEKNFCQVILVSNKLKLKYQFKFIKIIF